ncbi:MAG: hypothetical protein R3320_04905 [Nitriliruptorales bacterium]|nr:hypothetical protein [Nitriliruptorales bacterium]
MSRPTVRTFPPGRVVALALIAILAGGAAFVRLTSGVEPVSVPAGAQPGDLIIEPCTYEAEGGTYAADCGTLVVSENPDAPDSRLIALPVIRVRATSDESSEPVFYLTGGPGMSNMDVEYGGRFVGNRDFVLVGYRGIDGSVRLDCPEVESAIKRSADLLSGGAFQAIHDGYRTCADRLIGQGLDPASYGLVQQVDDLETARSPSATTASTCSARVPAPARR